MSLIVFELFEMPTVMAVIDHFMCPVKMLQIYQSMCRNMLRKSNLTIEHHLSKNLLTATWHPHGESNPGFWNENPTS